MTKHMMAGAFALAHPLAMIAGQKKEEGGGDDLAAIITGLSTDIKKKHDQFHEDLGKLQKDAGDQSADFKGFKDGVDEKLTKYNSDMKALSDKLDEIAQKAGRTGPGAVTVKSLGEQVAAAEGVKDFRKGRLAVKVEGDLGMKAISSLPASAGPLITNDRVPGVLGIPRRRMTVRGLLAAARTTSNAVEFVREKVVTNNAAIVAEGAEKPESDITYETDTAKVAKIAHWIHVPDETMADAPALAGMIDSRLRFGINYKEELQLLLGSGTGGNLKGLVTAASAFATPFSGAFTGSTNLDVLRIAALLCTVNEYMASGYVMNPVDWTLMELLKDGEGRYIIGNPQSELGASLWGLPVAATNAMPVDNFLSGAFDQAAQIFDREDTEVFLSTEDRDNFIKNMVTVLAEERLALAIYRGNALATGTFTAAKSALTAGP